MMTMNEYLRLAKTTILKHGGAYKTRLINDEDAVGEVANAMMMADYTYDDSKGAQPTTWRVNQAIFRISKIVRQMKRHAKCVGIPKGFDAIDKDTSLEGYEQILDDNRKIITEKQRKYIDAIYRDGYTMEEVAQQFGVSKQAICFTVNRAITKIRENGVFQ